MIPILKNIALQIRNNTTVAEVGYVAENWGQFETDKMPPVKTPACLIDFDYQNFSDLGELNQMGETEIVLTVINNPLFNPSFGATNTQQDNYYKTLETVNKINLAVHGWSPAPYASALVRKRLNRVIRNDGLHEIRINYSFNYQYNHPKDYIETSPSNIMINTQGGIINLHKHKKARFL